MSNKYITFRLGDNDFGNAMLHAMETMKKDFTDTLLNNDLDTIKNMIVSIMVGYQMAKHFNWFGMADVEKTFKHYYEYFDKGRISNELDTTKEDVDHGAVSIDLNVNYVWLH